MLLVLRTSLVAILAMGVLAIGGCSSFPRCLSGSTFPGFLDGVSATSPADAWAVGVDAAGRRNYTLIMHWNGTAWCRVASPSPGFYSGLSGVTASSATDAWAVGSYSTAPGGHTLILHWNGTAWSRVPSPSPGRESSLTAVTATSATDAWAVGTTDGSYHGLILHWNGTTWSPVPSPGPSGVEGTGPGVSATSPASAWVAGGVLTSAAREHTLISHWNGTTWSQVASPSPGTESELESVSAPSTDSTWAVGQYCTSACDDASNATWNGLILHWNGTAWSRVATPSPSSADGPLFSVSATSSGNAWAVGTSYASYHGLILHWSGNAWSRVPSPAGRPSLNAVTATSATSAWVVGQNFTGDQPFTLIMHWNGTRWSLS